jgi:uncharacterized protein
MKNYIGTGIIAVTIFASMWMLTGTYKNRNRTNDLINVTGLGKKDFVADLIVWTGSFRRGNTDLQAASAALDKDREGIRKFLMSKGVNEKEIVFTAVDISKMFDRSYDNEGREHSTFSGYELTQGVEIESNEVDKIELVSREVSELIRTGMEFTSDRPEYFYTKLAELKIVMIAEATKDATTRAQKIAENSDASLGDLRYATMGVFQITAQNSSEDYSWGGAFNTSSKRKTATITMKLQFGLN